MDWTKVTNRLPDPCEPVLVCCKPNPRVQMILRGEFVPAMHVMVTGQDDFGDEYGDYDEDEDEYYWTEGWYELIDNWDAYRAVRINCEVTHWMPLPDGPEES